eukprot:1178643-Prorocentrum_minimum.AAC.4
MNPLQRSCLFQSYNDVAQWATLLLDCHSHTLGILPHPCAYSHVHALPSLKPGSPCSALVWKCSCASAPCLTGRITIRLTKNRQDRLRCINFTAIAFLRRMLCWTIP